MLTIEAKSAVILVRVVKDIRELINNIADKFYGTYNIWREFFPKMSNMDIDSIEYLLGDIIVSPYFLIKIVSSLDPSSIFEEKRE